MAKTQETRADTLARAASILSSMAGDPDMNLFVYQSEAIDTVLAAIRQPRGTCATCQWLTSMRTCDRGVRDPEGVEVEVEGAGLKIRNRPDFGCTLHNPPAPDRG